MEKDTIADICPNIVENAELRAPQRAFYKAVSQWAESRDEREVSAILPVGAGKTGCIAITHLAFKSKKTLIVTPDLRINGQTLRNCIPTDPENFYLKYHILEPDYLPKVVDLRGQATTSSQVEEADIVVTNIHQLRSTKNGWLSKLPPATFDLMLFDEGHHNSAPSWDRLRKYFACAHIVNYSATPQRADGDIMKGKLIYQYAISRAIAAGHCKDIKARVVTPDLIKYRMPGSDEHRNLDGQDVRSSGLRSADFRSAVVRDIRAYISVVEASIATLNQKKSATGETRLKIIVAAQGRRHCQRIVRIYKARGLRADFVHCKNPPGHNDEVFRKLENHELDVIVQVRMLGEGFDHPFFSVAVVLNNFSELPPFYQFVGRAMRVLVPNSPKHPLNTATVIYHSGTNQDERWKEFEALAKADDSYYDNLYADFEVAERKTVATEITRPHIFRHFARIMEQGEVTLVEKALIAEEELLRNLVLNLSTEGRTADDVRELMLKILPPTIPLAS